MFGGVVPFDFVATKAITHPRLDHSAVVPHGWSDRFSERVDDVVLRGLSVFSEDDVYRGGIRLLEAGRSVSNRAERALPPAKSSSGTPKLCGPH
jgi:hypothetical protein